MTTTVTIEAHCAPDERVELVIHGNGRGDPSRVVVLRDGETAEDHVYDDKSITVRERMVSREDELREAADG